MEIKTELCFALTLIKARNTGIQNSEFCYSPIQIYFCLFIFLFLLVLCFFPTDSIYKLNKLLFKHKVKLIRVMTIIC